MLNKRLGAAQDVAAKLGALEAAIDEALISAGALVSSVPAARQKAGLSAVVGQDAITLTTESLTALNEARVKIVAAHHAFSEVQQKIGLKSYMSGDLWKEPSARETPLTLVSERTA